MKILSGFQPADSGEILIDGRAIDYTGPIAAIANGIGMLQQDPLDVGAFTVLENFIYGSGVGIGLRARAIRGAAERAERAIRLCARPRTSQSTTCSSPSGSSWRSCGCWLWACAR